MAEFRLQKGSIVPLHSHPHEQAGYLVSEQVRFSVGSKEILCNPGDSWCISGDKEHGAEALQDSVLVEVVFYWIPNNLLSTLFVLAQAMNLIANNIVSAIEAPITKRTIQQPLLLRGFDPACLSSPNPANCC